MKYELCIPKNENLSEGLRRILNERVDAILHYCIHYEADVHTSIHEIRRNIKKIRAILRLVRDKAGYTVYQNENLFYRDLGRLLSGIRSSEILSHSLNRLRKNFKQKLPGPCLDQLSHRINGNRDALIKELTGEQNIFRHIERTITLNRDRLNLVSKDINDFSSIQPAISRIYRQSRMHLNICKKSPGNVELHDFRKKVKYLVCHLQVLYPVFPGMLSVYIRSMDYIADNLGAYRDLYELEEFINKECMHELDHAEMIIKEIRTLNAQHLKKSMLKAEVIFTLKTGAFIGQLENYYQYWHYSKEV